MNEINTVKYSKINQVILAISSEIESKNNPLDKLSNEFKITKKNIGSIKNCDGVGLIHLAARLNMPNVINWLFEIGVPIDDFNYSKETSLHIAAKNKSLQAIETLLNHGANVHLINEKSKTPLHYVFEDVGLKYLFEDVGLKYPPIYQCFDLLIKHGADPLATADSNLNCFHFIGKMSLPNILPKEQSSTIHEQIHQCIDVLVKYGLSINLQTQNGYTPLYYAISSGLLDTAKYLLECGADPNIADFDQWTPLHSSARDSCIDRALLLLENGARMDLKDEHGLNAFDHAKSCGYNKWCETIAAWSAAKSAKNTIFDIVKNHQHQSLNNRKI